MKIKMDSLYISNFCFENIRHLHFCSDLENDILFKYFVTWHLTELYKASEYVDRLAVGYSYVIEDGASPVGYLRLSKLDPNGVLSLHYGVSPKYRNRHYGSRILREVSKYILNNNSQIKCIDLYINGKNSFSKKCAYNAGYNIYREIPDKNYVYRLRK